MCSMLGVRLYYKIIDLCYKITKLWQFVTQSVTARAKDRQSAASSQQSSEIWHLTSDI